MLAIPVILLLLSIGIARYAAQRHEAALRTGARHGMPGGQTAAEAAREFLDANEAKDVQILEHTAMVSDYFDPKRRTLFLTRATLNGTDAGSWAVALHEAAHATQEGDALKALNWRQGNIRLARYGPTLVAVVCLALTFLKRLPFRSTLLICGVLFALIMLANALSMPVEFNASRRVQAWIDEKLRKHPALQELFANLLSGVAWRDTGVFVRSPLYFIFSLLPGGGKLRPRK